MVWPKLDKIEEKVESSGAMTPQLTQQQKVEQKFVFEEAKDNGKIVFTLYGSKGAGKTTTALGFPGSISILSFDRKTLPAKNNSFHNRNDIRVYDAVQYYERDAKDVLKSSMKTYEYIIFLLENIKISNPDWVVIDGIEVMQKIAEFVMRARENIGPYSGVANLNFWKIRNSIVNEIHQRALDAAKKGVIYTTFTDRQEIVKEGVLITTKDVPKYIDTVMLETDVVLHVDSDYDTKTKATSIRLRCVSSKYDKIIATGTELDITGKTAKDFIKLDDIYGNSS